MLTKEQLSFFDAHGYLVVDNLLDHETILNPLIAEYEALLSDLRAHWVARGDLDPDAPSDNFQDKILSAYWAGLDYFQPMDISLPPGNIQLSTPFHAGAAVFNMMTSRQLLDVVEGLLGPEITCNPIQHVRIKPPASELASSEIRAHITSTDWHQDRAVTLEEADETRMLTVWLAITDATPENGCLQVIPGSHKGRMQPHCPNPQVGIPRAFLDLHKAKPIPVKRGGGILFHPLTIHGSLTNQTNRVRWSFDLRYNVTGEPTGRPMFPSFVARSRTDPASELRNAEAWRQLWVDCRRRLSAMGETTIHRWSPEAAHCA